MQGSVQNVGRPRAGNYEASLFQRLTRQAVSPHLPPTRFPASVDLYSEGLGYAGTPDFPCTSAQHPFSVAVLSSLERCASMTICEFLAAPFCLHSDKTGSRRIHYTEVLNRLVSGSRYGYGNYDPNAGPIERTAEQQRIADLLQQHTADKQTQRGAPA